jgi:hypothetical protein
MAQAARMTIEVTKMIEPAKAVLAPAGNTLSEAWAAVIGDRVAAWRLKNAAALQVKVNEECASLGLKVDRAKIPERYAIAWFEEATKQDEPEIQELFARLLARAVAGDADAADRRLLEIVGRLTPLDAQVMQWLFATAGPPPKHPNIKEWDAMSAVQRKFGEQGGLSVEHLVVLGVFERQFFLQREGSVMTWQTLDAGYPIHRLAEDIQNELIVMPELSASWLGMRLYSACLKDFEPRTPEA